MAFLDLRDQGCDVLLEQRAKLFGGLQVRDPDTGDFDHAILGGDILEGFMPDPDVVAPGGDVLAGVHPDQYVAHAFH